MDSGDSQSVFSYSCTGSCWGGIELACARNMCRRRSNLGVRSKWVSSAPFSTQTDPSTQVSIAPVSSCPIILCIPVGEIRRENAVFQKGCSSRFACFSDRLPRLSARRRGSRHQRARHQTRSSTVLLRLSRRHRSHGNNGNEGGVGLPVLTPEPRHGSAEPSFFFLFLFHSF